MLCSVLSVNGKQIETRSSISRYRLSYESSLISVEFKNLEVSGHWKADAEPCERTVYENESGRVHWNCVQPRAEVEVSVAGSTLSGLGYAECLTLTIPPWQLPIHQLRWGRFVSPQDSLAWVDWQGSYNSSFAVRNGEALVPASVSDAEVSVEGGTLRMEGGLPLRTGRLRSTVLPGVSPLSKLLPSSIFNLDEQKWRSRGKFDAHDRTSIGWVIHEVVRWKI